MLLSVSVIGVHSVTCIPGGTDWREGNNVAPWDKFSPARKLTPPWIGFESEFPVKRVGKGE